MTDATITLESGSDRTFADVIDAITVLADGDNTETVEATSTPTSFDLEAPIDEGTLTGHVEGSGFTYANDDEGYWTVTGGTVNSIQVKVNDTLEGTIDSTFAVADLANAVQADDTDPTALEHYLMGFNYTYFGTDVADNMYRGLTVGDNVPFNLIGNDEIHLGGGNDQFYSGDGDDQIYGDAGDDTLDGGAGADLLDGGAGHDAVNYTASPAGVTVNLVTGTGSGGDAEGDQLVSIEGILGSSHDDVLTLNDGDGLYVFDRAGNDTVTGGAGDDMISYRDDGYDQSGPITHGVTVDLIHGTATDGWGGTDTIANIEGVEGTRLADTITGGNAVYGSLRGNAGDDTINTYGGAVAWGGAGNDTIIAHDTGSDDSNYVIARYSDATTGIFANLTSTSQGGLAGGDPTSGYQIADGLGGVDTISGVVTIQDGTHDDQFVVDDTFQSLYGNWVEIRLTQGDDSVTFNGTESGTVSYAGGVGGGVLADLEAGTATDVNAADGFIGHDTFHGATQFRGSSFADTIDGSNGNDSYIRGEAGDDTIHGRAGDDVIDGDDRAGNPDFSGNDHLFGDAGNDTLFGGPGDDTLVGGSGHDTLDGGAGTDVSVLSGLHGGGSDIIEVGDTVYALDGADHSYDTITNVESFQDPDQTMSLSDVRSFDPLAYAASYNDLADTFHTDAGAALTHYLTTGFYQHRHATFDAEQYLANYSDLRAAFGDDTQAATSHFLTYGINEHRLAEDPLDYIASYSDLIQTYSGHSEDQLKADGLSNYMTEGDEGGRRGGIDFDADQYLANYSDLQAAFGDDDDAAAAHFIDYGYAEHRLWEDPLEYIASYGDLVQAVHDDSPAQMESMGKWHYQAYGFNEGRQAGIDFNVDQYLANYADLRAAFADGHGGYDDDAALYHYIEYGYYEGRTDHVLTA